MLISMEVIGVRVEMPSNQPIVLLKEIDGSRFLPIWVGAVEATAIAFAQQGVQPPRPLTHDLAITIIEDLDATLTAVHVTHIDQGVFYANLIIRDGAGATRTISARPSDAISLAIRSAANILASSELLDEIGIEIPAETAPGEENQEVERFREFLEQINPEDFAG
ncbi:MAG: bifunctional nuclease family protein [Actinobacteria bacterium]|nr:bifunctional nuclease family protein [Actinomycetota bacterium]MSX71707.1 bifunctional nuclease family protein [Actinomycetota bacterium]MSY69281.1 bifunctional nuclease family protein [Actinomycetota bacterium]MTA75622.1 bifunctional nuclease family protein [Actinomycetota bacterium]